MHATSSSSSSSWWPLTSLKSTVIRYHALLLALLASCYLAQAKFDACAPSRRCNVVWNLHIPRTGGMSTHHVVTSLFTPHPIGQNSLANANASPRYAQERRQQLEDISQKLEALMLTVQRDPAPLRWMYVYHGVQGGSMDKMLAYVDSVSADNGKTWDTHYDIETTPGEYSYPALVAWSDGEGFDLTYTHKRSGVAFASLSLAELRELSTT